MNGRKGVSERRGLNHIRGERKKKGEISKTKNRNAKGEREMNYTVKITRRKVDISSGSRREND